MKPKAPGEFARSTLEMIDRRMIETGVTQRILGKRMGVSEARISQVLASNSNMTLRTVDRLLHAIAAPDAALKSGKE